jgi:hypothetical protein
MQLFVLGAVGVGRQRLSKQEIMRRSMSDLLVQRELVCILQ